MGPEGDEEWDRSPWSSYKTYCERNARYEALGSSSSSSSASSSMPPLADIESDSSQPSNSENDDHTDNSSSSGLSALIQSLRQVWVAEIDDEGSS